MSIEWSETLRTGLREIDSQHKELFAHINRLFEACEKGRRRDEVTNTIQFLGDYVKNHFRAEESAMRKYSYPNYANHKAQHEKFMQGFAELKQKIATQQLSGLAVTLGTNHLLGDWWINHINNTDKVLARFVMEKEKEPGAKGSL